MVTSISYFDEKFQRPDYDRWWAVAIRSADITRLFVEYSILSWRRNSGCALLHNEAGLKGDLHLTREMVINSDAPLKVCGVHVGNLRVRRS